MTTSPSRATLLPDMSNTPQWITDRLPTEADETWEGHVMKPYDERPGWRPTYRTNIKPGEPWAPYPVMPPYEPPPPVYRSWTPEEAAGRVVRRKGVDCFLVIVRAGADRVHLDGMDMSWATLEGVYEQPDGRPCGVEVTS